MFMCNQCWEQYEDDHLAYSLILESRLSQPAKDLYVLKFCSLYHVQEFLHRIANQQQRYVLTKVGKNGETSFEPDVPKELLLLVGSSKAS